MIKKDDEKTLFEQEMQKVKPLSKKFDNKINLKKKNRIIKVPVKFQDVEENVEVNDFSLMTVEPIDTEQVLSYKTDAVAKNQFNKLRKGQVIYQSYLDLHQATRHQAISKIKKFIDKNINHHIDCCLIIHGKGQGLIKSVTEKTLQSHKNVTAFHSALAVHGGTGAIYVLLKS